MKRLIKSSFIGLLVIVLVLITFRAPQAAPPPSQPIAAPQLDIEQFRRSLDRKDTTTAIRLVEEFWRSQYESYYGGSLTLQQLDARAISQKLKYLYLTTNNKAALIYIVPTPTHLELIFVPPGAPPIHRRVSTKREVLLQTVKAFRDQVTDPYTQSATYLPAAQSLYQLIIAPLERDLKLFEVETLVFCLGGGLRTVPLAALHDGKQFLIEKYKLGIIPAFNLLDSQATVLHGTQVLAMGASKFEELAPLPAVPLELQIIASTLWQGKVLLNQNFTIKNLKASRSEIPYGILHVATHADFSPGSVSDSYIQFWDKRLSPNQMNELNLRSPAVQLLVLSACRTAVGSPQAELGFAGLSVMSGSKASIASLWHISDAGTLLLMTRFYKELKTTRKTEALRQAQIAMIKKQATLEESLALRGDDRSLPNELQQAKPTDFSHPFYWASFVLIGSVW
ncbi:MAG TPA: CHAT domain-containing protein [Leptolyngbyaceae cyanobacterium M33_DOE_097]|nr:CHAT domain-containing protein [Leptolyngbyaceae cyanobacterium M33_DOE_097]